MVSPLSKLVPEGGNPQLRLICDQKSHLNNKNHTLADLIAEHDK
jgi:hypothetical protein